MSSEVDICNLALSNIRAGSIGSLDESSLPAQQCKLKYPLLRDQMLTAAFWGFNRGIKALSLLSSVDVYNWAYAYQYPADCLKVNRLVSEHESLLNADASVVSRLIDSGVLPTKDFRQQVSYEMFNIDGVRVIASNEPNLRVDYAVRITDTNMFPVDFVLALSHLLASEIAIPIVGAETGRQLRGDSLTIYKEYLSTAIADDLNQEYFNPPLSESETIRR